MSEYEAYLASPAWTTKRQEALMHYGSACQMCGITRNLDVHHVSYQRLGAELIGDLRILCRPCHYSIHDAIATIGGGNRTHPKHLRKVTDRAIFNARGWKPPTEPKPVKQKPQKKRKRRRAKHTDPSKRRFTPEQKRERRAVRRAQGGPLSAADQLALDESRRQDDLARARTTYAATRGLVKPSQRAGGHTAGLGGRWGT